MTDTQTSQSLLQPTRSPRLPAPSIEYSKDMLDQMENALRLYFNQIDNTTQSLLGPAGGRFLAATYGTFYDTTTQTIVSTTDAYALTLNSTDGTSGVSVVSGSRITPDYPGVYNIQFSAQLTNTDSQIQDADIWFRLDGTDIPDSNSRFSIPSSHGGNPGALIAALNLVITVPAGSYVELMWCATSTLVAVETLPAGTSPTRPRIPSVIVTVSFVSRLP